MPRAGGVKVDQVEPHLNRPERWRSAPPLPFASAAEPTTSGARSASRCGHSGYPIGQSKEMAASVRWQPHRRCRSRFGDDSVEAHPSFFTASCLILPEPKPAGKSPGD